MSAPYAHELQIACLAVQRASILTKTVLRSILKANVDNNNETSGSNPSSITKTDQSPVTIADFAAQSLLISAIHSAFPTDLLVGEENSDDLRANPSLRDLVWETVQNTHLDDESEALIARPQSVEDMMDLIDLGGKGQGDKKGRVWMMDPIDGTKTFLRNQQFAVSLALVEDGKEAVGVVGGPNLRLDEGRAREDVVDEEGFGIMLCAVKGQGTYLRTIGREGLLSATRLEPWPKIADAEDLKWIESSINKAQSHEKARRLAAEVGGDYPGTDLYCSQIRYLACALTGAVQVRIPADKNKASYAWDHAGGQLLYTEAGGVVTDLNGEETDFGVGRTLGNNWGYVIARREVLSRILEVVKAIVEADKSNGP
ncbi:hypothetical protein BJ875DRAFT_117606 [Amylocarpus encephaloides]|uniref:3'(2'),5'-bisphosphate nucleotidase n=1 Tax=Amylocarpus encephaloides TaxID=45428 RepID=A0A9P8C2U6_9HELO|nr:hypothetical protein BJ875DRAFT_117606 [Amylocarpus encephaloides]